MLAWPSAFVLGATLAVMLGLASPPAEAGSRRTLRGSVEIAEAGLELRKLGPIVVYLEPRGPMRIEWPTEGATTIRQKNATFVPSFRAISKGQTVDMPNEDEIYHNVFSYSRPNEFDLGTYPAGESRGVKFQHPGVVRTYCSIHENMNATIFVAPTPLFAVVRASGDFVIRDVPPGSYRLKTFSERLPEIERLVEVLPNADLEVEIAWEMGED